jgi:hypothetical protein
MQYQLKKTTNEFQVTREGEFEYHRFKHGVVYDKVPPEEADKFETIEDSEDAKM